MPVDSIGRWEPRTAVQQHGRLGETAMLFLIVLGACSPPPTVAPVTLTPPPPTQTPAIVQIVPPAQLGSTFIYADGTLLAAIPSGSFQMGQGKGENPEHLLRLSDFWIYSTEVTNHQYANCVQQAWCSAPEPLDNPDFSNFDALNAPVVGLTYEQASDYCRFMGGTLPTEAQWEKAARGSDGRPYPWGTRTPSCDLLNFQNCLKHASDVTQNTKGSSPYGVLNMAGNVYEWVADWYDPLYYETSPAGDPPGPAVGQARVIRSSGYRSTADQSLSYARSYASPNDHRPDLGFRCVVEKPTTFAPACQLTPVIDSANGAAVRADCPQLSIDVQVSACRYGGGAVVTFGNDHAQDPNASFGGIVGCSLLLGQPGSYPLTYQCRRASIAVLSSTCSYLALPPGTCPASYEFNEPRNECLWEGQRAPGIDCPAGEFFDPVQHCCRIESGDLADYAVCPVGTVFTVVANDTYACLPSQVAKPAPRITAEINPPICGNLCDLSVELCNLRNLVFCPTTCSCLAVGRKCPEP